MRQFQINGKPYWFATSHDLVKVTGFRIKTIQRWEKKGVFPKPSITRPIKTGLGTFEQRLYLEDQVELIVGWLEKYDLIERPKRRVDPEWLVELHSAWREIDKKFKETIKGGNNAHKKEEEKAKEKFQGFKRNK